MNSKLLLIAVICTLYFVTFISAFNASKSDIRVQSNDNLISNVATITEDSSESVNVFDKASNVPNQFVLNQNELKNIENLMKKRRQNSARR